MIVSRYLKGAAVFAGMLALCAAGAPADPASAATSPRGAAVLTAAGAAREQASDTLQVLAARVPDGERRDTARSDSTGMVLDSIVVLPEVIVERSRSLSVARQRRPTAFVTELVAGQRGRAIETLGDLLETAPGARVVRYGGLGAFSTLSLRGAPSGQVAVYLDGMPVTSAAQTVVNLSDLPVTAIERIEVYRGGSPLSLGPGRPGGAVNLVTRAMPASTRARVARGSFGTWEARSTAGGSLGTLSGWLHAGYQGSNGDYRYADDNGTPFNPNDDAISTRANNRFDATSALANAAWQPNDVWRVTLGANVQQKAEGFPGLGSTPARNARNVFLRSVGRVGVERTIRAATIDLDASTHHTRTRFRDREGDLGLGRHDTDDRFRAEDLRLTLETPLPVPGVRLIGAANLREERAELHDDLDGRADPPASRRTSRGAMLELRVSPFERLQLVAAQRWDRVADRLRYTGLAGARTSDVTREVRAPQLGARLALPAGFELRANWSEAERVPDFMELFGNQGGVAGNPDLKPERADSRDAGFAWRLPRVAGVRASLDWAHFESTTENLIVFLQHSNSSVKAQNISRARIRGEELSFAIDTPFGVDAQGALTWQSAHDEGDVPFWYGRRLPQQPGQQRFVQVGVRRGAARLATDVQYLSDNYLDRANRKRAPSRTLLGASLAYALRGGALQITLEGRNLTDHRVTDVAGYPLPGRSLFVSVDMRLGQAAPDF